MSHEEKLRALEAELARQDAELAEFQRALEELGPDAKISLDPSFFETLDELVQPATNHATYSLGSIRG